MENKRKQQKESTKKLLIETAYAIYSKKGFSVPTSEIAKKAKVSHGTIFAHFPTVNHLITFLINDFGEALTAELHEKSLKVNSIKDFLGMHIEVISKYENFYHHLISEFNALNEESKLSFICLQSAASFHLGSTIDRLKHKHNFINIPVYMVFNTWIGLIHYYLQNTEYFIATGSVLKKYKNELINSFIKMIIRR